MNFGDHFDDKIYINDMSNLIKKCFMRVCVNWCTFFLCDQIDLK